MAPKPSVLMASEAYFHIRNQIKILNYPDIYVHVAYYNPYEWPLWPWQPLRSHLTTELNSVTSITYFNMSLWPLFTTAGNFFPGGENRLPLTSVREAQHAGKKARKTCKGTVQPVCLSVEQECRRLPSPFHLANSSHATRGNRTDGRTGMRRRAGGSIKNTPTVTCSNKSGDSAFSDIGMLCFNYGL